MTRWPARTEESRLNTGLVGGLVLSVAGTLALVNQLWVAAGVVAVVGLAIIGGAVLWRR